MRVVVSESEAQAKVKVKAKAEGEVEVALMTPTTVQRVTEVVIHSKIQPISLSQRETAKRERERERAALSYLIAALLSYARDIA